MVAVDATTRIPIGLASTLHTSCVILAPYPTPRCMIPINVVDGIANLELEGCTAASRTLILLSYNVLSDLYATSDMYNYCPSWALSWTYHCQNLLHEIVGYQEDILCLQEVLLSLGTILKH